MSSPEERSAKIKERFDIDGLNLIYQWVKTGDISYKEFVILLKLIKKEQQKSYDMDE